MEARAVLDWSPGSSPWSLLAWSLKSSARRCDCYSVDDVRPGARVPSAGRIVSLFALGDRKTLVLGDLQTFSVLRGVRPQVDTTQQTATNSALEPVMHFRWYCAREFGTRRDGQARSPSSYDRLSQ